MTKKNIKPVLYDRKASLEENELIISRMDSTYQAAKLRNTLYDKPSEEFHSPVEFSWAAFWKTMYGFNSTRSTI